MFKSTYGTMYYVDQMNQAIMYYKSKLGLEPSYESPEWTEFAIGGGHRICLHNKVAGETYTPNGVLIMDHNGVKALFEQMTKDGLKPFGLHEVHPGHFTFHLKDPSGNELSVFGPA